MGKIKIILKEKTVLNHSKKCVCVFIFCSVVVVQFTVQISIFFYVPLANKDIKHDSKGVMNYFTV